jgi:hypothetical protein
MAKSNLMYCKEGNISMKRSFLLTVILGALLTSQVYGQTKKATTTTTPIATQAAEAPKSDFDKFYERLSIGYFGALTTPNFDNWDSREAAISPEFSGGTNNDTYSMNVWSQVNIGYSYGGKFKFNVIPRFTVLLDEAPTQDPGERGNVLLEDALVGFSGVLYASDDKKFSWWMRPGVRLPTSHATRNADNADFGKISYNLELLTTLTYDFNPAWQLGTTYMNRYWIYEQRYNNSKHRHYISPFITHTLNDTTKIQLYYELMLQNNNRRESINGLSPVYKDLWQNAYIGVAKDITPKMNVFPFISAFVNDPKFGMQSFWAGLWVSYQIK